MAKEEEPDSCVALSRPQPKTFHGPQIGNLDLGGGTYKEITTKIVHLSHKKLAEAIQTWILLVKYLNVILKEFYFPSHGSIKDHQGLLTALDPNYS